MKQYLIQLINSYTTTILVEGVRECTLDEAFEYGYAWVNNGSIKEGIAVDIVVQEFIPDMEEEV